MKTNKPTITIASLLLIMLTFSSKSDATAIVTASSTQDQPDRPVLLTDPVADPSKESIRYFTATGHTLRGAFLDHWEYNGGLQQFGYPLTEEFFEPDGPDNQPLWVQYFERNRLELHPVNMGTSYQVLLGTLGREFHVQDPAAAPLPSPAIYFPETGHNLAEPFNTYWQAHGGLSVHGYPITEATRETNPNDGEEYLVQWFERSRMEWHPENVGSPYEVLLGLLGTQSAQQKGYPYGWYPPRGRAVDWSWVTGHLLPHRMCFARVCSCPMFEFGGGQFISPLVEGLALVRESGVDPYSTDNFVLFGHRAGPNEQDDFCHAALHIDNYVIEHVQLNPAR